MWTVSSSVHISLGNICGFTKPSTKENVNITLIKSHTTLDIFKVKYSVQHNNKSRMSLRLWAWNLYFVHLWTLLLTTVRCHYNAVSCNMIFHTSLHWLTQNINQRLDSQKTLHSSSSLSYGVSIVKIWGENWPCYNGTTLYLSTQPPTGLHNHLPDSKVHGANMGPTWVLSAPDGPQVGPINLAINVPSYLLPHHNPLHRLYSVYALNKVK